MYSDLAVIRIYIVPRSANPEHPCASAQSQILLSISRTHRAGCMASNFSRIHDGPSDNACIYIITDGGVIHYLLAWPDESRESPTKNQRSSRARTFFGNSDTKKRVGSGDECPQENHQNICKLQQKFPGYMTPPFRQNNKTPFPGRKTRHIQA